MLAAVLLSTVEDVADELLSFLQDIINIKIAEASSKIAGRFFKFGFIENKVLTVVQFVTGYNIKIDQILSSSFSIAVLKVTLPLYLVTIFSISLLPSSLS